MKHLRILSWALLGAVAAGCSELEPFQTNSNEPRAKDGPKWIDTSKGNSDSSDSSDQMAAAADRPTDQGAPAGEPRRGDSNTMTMDEAEMIRTVQALPTGNPDTSALLLEKLAPAEVIRGVDFEYQLRVRNLTDAVLDNVVIEERATSNLNIKEADPAPTSNEGGTASWDLGSLAKGEELTINVRAAALEGTEVQGLAQASYRTAMRTQIAVIAPALEVKLAAPSVAATGEDIPLELTVRNTGSGDARDILLNSTLPSGLMTAQGEQTVAIPVGTLSSGQSKTVQIMARAARAGEYTATAEASMRHGATVSSQGQTVLVQEPSLEMLVSGPTKAFIGRPSRWNLKVRNVGGGDAKDVAIEHMIPAGMKFVQASEAPEESGQKLTWNLGKVAAGAEKSIDLYLQAENAGAAEVTAKVAGAGAAGASNSSKVSLEGMSALQLEIDDLTDPVLVGDSLTYHVKVYNQGSAPGTNINLTIELDEGMQLVRAQGPTSGEADGKKIVFAPYGSLAPDETATWRIVVKSVTAGDLRLSASMTSDLLTRPVSENESTQFYQ